MDDGGGDKGGDNDNNDARDDAGDDDDDDVDDTFQTPISRSLDCDIGFNILKKLHKSHF